MERLVTAGEEMTWRGLPVYQRYELYVGDFGTALAEHFKFSPAFYEPFTVLGGAMAERHIFGEPLAVKHQFGEARREVYEFGEALA